MFEGCSEAWLARLAPLGPNFGRFGDTDVRMPAVLGTTQDGHSRCVNWSPVVRAFRAVEAVYMGG